MLSTYIFDQSMTFATLTAAAMAVAMGAMLAIVLGCGLAANCPALCHSTKSRHASRICAALMP